MNEWSTNEWTQERTNESISTDRKRNDWLIDRSISIDRKRNELSTNEWTNERTNEWMNEWTNKQTNEWINIDWSQKERMINEWMNERTNEWMNKTISIDRKRNEWTNEQMNQYQSIAKGTIDWIDRSQKEWMINQRMNERTNDQRTNEQRMFKRRARSRHETLNRRIKIYKCTSNCFVHSMQKHGMVFEAVCVLVQYQIESESPLFAVWWVYFCIYLVRWIGS